MKRKAGSLQGESLCWPGTAGQDMVYSKKFVHSGTPTNLMYLIISHKINVLILEVNDISYLFTFP